MDANEELVKMIDQTNDAVWFPVAIVGSLLGFIIFLLSYIWKRSEARNNERHQEHEATIAKLTDTQVEQKEILSELRALTKSHDRDIERLKDIT